MLARDVAIKTLWVSPGPDGVPEAEASVAAGRLQHAHILAVHDAFYGPPLDDGRLPLHLVMPYVPGRTLRALITRPDPADPPLDLRRKVELIIQVGEAIRYAHRKGLSHRDVKSDNILISEEGSALLIDWGIAAPAAEGFGWAFSPRWGGTFLVMAPEVVDGKVLASFQADVYGVGVLLFEVLEGCHVPRKSRHSDRPKSGPCQLRRARTPSAPGRRWARRPSALPQAPRREAGVLLEGILSGSCVRAEALGVMLRCAPAGARGARPAARPGSASRGPGAGARG